MQSENVDKLFEALSAAQGEFDGVAFDAVNPFLKNRYATLGAVIEAAKPVLVKYGLSVSQLVSSEAGAVGVTTILGHASGQWISGTAHLPLESEKGKSSAQVAGSIVTYLRRYGYAAVLGLYAEADDDGNAGQNGGAQKPAEVEEKPNKNQKMIEWLDGTSKPADKLIDLKTINRFMEKYVGAGKKLVVQHLKNHLREHFHVDTLQEMTWEKLLAFVNHLEGNGDDARWYATEEKKATKKAEKKDPAALVDLDKLAQKWQGAPYGDLDAASQERIQDMLALVTAESIAPDDIDAMVEVLKA